ncbi:beta-eliminating lyase-related protein [Vibrio lentus]|nr:beta-eliminating lyase-related protein [Vibrio lentus]
MLTWQARDFVNQHDTEMHLDGARVYNAAVALDVHIKEIAQHFDSMTSVYQKGLGAPIGSLLLGSKEYIAKHAAYVKNGGWRYASS